MKLRRRFRVSYVERRRITVEVEATNRTEAIHHARSGYGSSRGKTSVPMEPAEFTATDLEPDLAPGVRPRRP
jgi:hypothetical protein